MSFTRSMQKRLGRVFGVTAAAVLLMLPLSALGATNGFEVDVSTYLGSAGVEDAVHSAHLLANGTIILAGRFGALTAPGAQEYLLNGATAQSTGAVVRLSADARQVLSITRIGDIVADLAVDGQENLYCALGDKGVAILNTQASQLLWAKSFPKAAHRVDVSPGGYLAILTASEPNVLSQKIASATCYLFSPQRDSLSTFGGSSHYTRDICVDEQSKTVVTIGFTNYGARVCGGMSYPVDVPGYKGYSFSGEAKYSGYNYSSDKLNPPVSDTTCESNMADARGHRCIIGPDGYLYMSFEVDGGNYVFDNDPQDITKKVQLVGGDKHHQSYNSTTSPAQVFGRFDASTGSIIRAQYFCVRNDKGVVNSNYTRNGDIRVDTDGTIYLSGFSASGLPLTFDPVGGYTGGAYLLVMNADFTTRLYCGRIGQAARINKSESAVPIAVRTTNGKTAVLWSGSTNRQPSSGFFTRNALQTQLVDSIDGFFAFIAKTQALPGNTPPTAGLSISDAGAGQLQFDASRSTDSNGDMLQAWWSFNDGTPMQSGMRVNHSYPYPIEQVYRITLSVFDGKGGWDTKDYSFGRPTAHIRLLPYGG